MCMFCAAIPVAAATGMQLNSRQLQARRAFNAARAPVASADEITNVELPRLKPIMPITGGVIALLLVGSVTYHTLTRLPF